MPLKAIVDKLDDVPESVRGEYAEKDGKFYLSVEAVDGFALEDVNGLKGTLSKELAKRKTAETELEKFKGIDPAKARTALEELEELKAIDPEKEADKIVSAKLEAAKSQLVAKHNQELEVERSKSTKYRAKIEELLLDTVATEALAKEKGSIDLLLPHIRSKARVVEEGDDFKVEVIDKEGNVRIGDSKGSPMSIVDLVLEMRDSDTFGRAFEGNGVSGTGKGPGNGRGGSPTLKRSQMTPEQKHEYQQKHGQAAFLKLPK